MDKKKIILIGGAIVFIGIFIFLVLQYKPLKDASSGDGADATNITYQIDGQTVELKDGAFDIVSDDAASEATIKYFGNDVLGDFNGDGREDQAFILTKESGGSGTFYYIVAALTTADGYKGTNGILLGDRIAPQTTEFKDGQIIVNYADRKPTEPFTTEPSVGVSKYLKISGESLVEVAK